MHFSRSESWAAWDSENRIVRRDPRRCFVSGKHALKGSQSFPLCTRAARGRGGGWRGPNCCELSTSLPSPTPPTEATIDKPRQSTAILPSELEDEEEVVRALVRDQRLHRKLSVVLAVDDDN